MTRAGKTKLTVSTAVALVVVALLVLSMAGCSGTSTNAAALDVTYNFECVWDGVNGAVNNLPGASTLWILTGSGLTEASLHVVYSNTDTADITGDIQGNGPNGGGSAHFVVPANDSATVTSATAHYNTFDGKENTNCVVTISHTISTTTTTEQVTTTTVGGESSTTTTTEKPTTTTTTEQGTTTTLGQESSTTTTTEEQGTTTTLGQESSTTTEQVTTTAVGEESSTTTTVGNLTTVTGIQTGGGGTAGPGAGVWILGMLAIALAGGLGWSAVRAIRK